MRLGAAAALLLAATACAHPAPRGAESRTASDSTATEPVWLTVQSHNRANVVLYAVRGTMRQRLGTVTAAATQRFELPPNVVRDAGGFALVAEPIGGDSPGRTDVLHVYQGQRIVWTLESRLAQASVAIY